MGSSLPPAMANDPKLIFFTDWDGTVTLEDSNDMMTDNIGYGAAKRKAGNQDVLDGRRTFRDAFQEMMDSIRVPFFECVDMLCEHVNLDPGFKAFYQWSRENNVPIVILSGGMRPIILALLNKLLDPGWQLEVVSNDVQSRDGKDIDEVGGWNIKFHDDSDYGHDKSSEIRKYSSRPDRPLLFYAGDGVSDLSAARETDLLFAKEGRDLVTYSKREGIPFVTFKDWTQITETCKEIMSGKTTVEQVVNGAKAK